MNRGPQGCHGQQASQFADAVLYMHMLLAGLPGLVCLSTSRKKRERRVTGEGSPAEAEPMPAQDLEGTQHRTQLIWKLSIHHLGMSQTSRKRAFTPMQTGHDFCSSVVAGILIPCIGLTVNVCVCNLASSASNNRKRASYWESVATSLVLAVLLLASAAAPLALVRLFSRLWGLNSSHALRALPLPPPTSPCCCIPARPNLS